MESFTEFHTIAPCSRIIHDDVYSPFVCYDSVDDELDSGVICNIEGEKLDAWMM